MIKKINEFLKIEGIDLEVSKERKDTLIYNLVEGFSKEVTLNSKNYTLELLAEKNDNEIVYKGVCLTKNGVFATTYTV